MIDIERAKKDFEYFYNNILVTEDKDGNKVSMPPLKDYQKAFYKWLEDCSKRGIKAVCCPNIRFEFYRRND